MKKITEQRNKASNNIDKTSTLQILSIINYEDTYVPLVIKNHLKEISKLIDNVVLSLKNQGRLFYIGCGSSGRLGILDAVECPPTFSVSNNLVQGIIAGGSKALYKSVEGAEDSEKEGERQLIRKNINKNDIIIGISANGSAKFVLGALKYAKTKNSYTGLLTFNKIKKHSYLDKIISINVGPEVIAGSTRMKAGTATKIILNMITTTSMISINKTYKNIMVDLKISNDKLLDRGIKIISSITNLNYNESLKLLKKSKNSVKTAIVMNKLNLDYNSSRKILKLNEGSLRDVLK